MSVYAFEVSLSYKTQDVNCGWVSLVSGLNLYFLTLWFFTTESGQNIAVFNEQLSWGWQKSSLL